MPQQKLFILDDDIIKFLNENRKEFVNEKNIVTVAMREFMAKTKKERYDKMLNQLNLKQYDTD